MQAGELIGGKWRLLAEAPSFGAVRRWRAVASDTGEPVEILTLRPGTSADGRRRFAAAHQQLCHAADPALNPTLDLLQDPSGPAAIRAPLEDPTLAEVRSPLSPAQVAAIGARLLPAVLAAGGSTSGALLAHDIGIDAAGQPVLAPHARPLSHVDRAVSSSVAPECFEGAIPDGAAGLYGLGMILYALATGRAAIRPTVEGRRAPPPAPSVIHPAVPPTLDEAILTLLSPHPGRRAGAMPLLLGLIPSSEEPLDLRDHLKTPQQTPEPASPRTRRVPQARPDAVAAARVVIPAKDLERLDPAERSAAAGYAGLPLSVVETLAEERLPLVLSASSSSSVARRAARDLAARSALPVVAASSSPFANAAAALTVLTLSVVAGVGFGLIALLFYSPMLMLVGAVLGSGSLLISGGLWLWARSAGSLHTAAGRGARRIEELQRSLDPQGRLTPSWQRLAEVRKALSTADIPPAASSDLRGALRDLERRLQRLAEVDRTAQQALSGLDRDRLKTRLAALERRAATDPSARAERDQLTRTLVDLDAVVERQGALSEEARRIHATLNEVTTALARLSEPGELEAEALSDLVRTTSLVSQTLAEPAPSPPQPPPNASEEP